MKASGANCAFNEQLGVHAIHFVTEKNDKKAIQIMLNQRIQIDTPAKDKRTPLIIGMLGVVLPYSEISL